MSEFRLAELDSSASGLRDAFHVPAIVATSHEEVTPGQKVKFVYVSDGDTRVIKWERPGYHGVISPFLENIPFGSRFWVLIMPEFVGSLRHVFDINIVGASYVSDYDDDGCRGCY